MVEFGFFMHSLVALALVATSALISWLMVRRATVLDHPNARSSHGASTPTLGGVAIVTAFFMGSVLMGISGRGGVFFTPQYLGFCAAVLLLAGVSLYDDIRDLPFTVRLAVQALAAAVAMASGITLPGLLGHALTFFWILYMINAVNFMDGLNGMAGGNSLIVALCFGLICLGRGSSPAWIISYMLAAGTLGFLIFNFPKGRLFMGDVGSTFLGFAFAALAVMAGTGDAAPVSLAVMPLLFFHFIYDTAFTLLRRLKNGENIFKAHKSHLYQLVNQLGYSHAAVTGVYGAMAALQGLGALWLAGHPGGPWRLFVFLPFLGLQLAFSGLVMQQGKKKSDRITR